MRLADHVVHPGPNKRATLPWHGLTRSCAAATPTALGPLAPGHARATTATKPMRHPTPGPCSRPPGLGPRGSARSAPPTHWRLTQGQFRRLTKRKAPRRASRRRDHRAAAPPPARCAAGPAWREVERARPQGGRQKHAWCVGQAVHGPRIVPRAHVDLTTRADDGPWPATEAGSRRLDRFPAPQRGRRDPRPERRGDRLRWCRDVGASTAACEERAALRDKAAACRAATPEARQSCGKARTTKFVSPRC